LGSVTYDVLPSKNAVPALVAEEVLKGPLSWVHCCAAVLSQV
jgi:hypothetical protein